MGRITTVVVSLALAFGILLSAGGTASANALAGGGYSSSYAGESVFESKAAGATGQFSAIFFNDGTQTWAPGVVGLLVCLADKVTCNVASPNASYASGWYSTTVYATVSAAVAPGQNGFFIYNWKVPAGTAGSTAATFNGDVGLIATGTMLRPEGYYQVNTTPAVLGTLTISPTSASVGVGGQQQFTATTNLTGTVNWSVTGGCGAVTAAGLFVSTAMNSSTQPCSVVASIGSLTASAPITVFGSAASLSCSASPASVVANGGSASGGTTTVTITVKDVNGNTVATNTPAIVVANASPALATVTPTGSIAATNGVATVTVASTTATGQIIVSASSVSTITGCNAIITSGAAGSPTQTVASFVQNPIAADGGLSSSTFRADLLDANGNRTTDSATIIDLQLGSGFGVCNVTGVITGTSGSAGGTTGTATDVNGRVEFAVTSTSVPGTCTFTATPRNTSISAGSATLTTRIVGYPTRLAVTANDSPHSAGSSSLTKITVAVQDALGSQVTSSTLPIAVALDANSCTGAGAGSVVVSSAGATRGGQAVFGLTSNGAYPSCAVSFSASGITGTSTTVTFTPGAPDHLGCAFTPSAIVNDGSSIAVGLVTVQDVVGNIVTSGSYSVAFSRSGGASTSLLTQSPQTMSGGGAVGFTVKSTTTVGTDTYAPSLYSGSLPTVAANTSCSIAVKVTLP